MGYTKDQLLAWLQELNIDFTCYDHPAVLTVEAQAKYVGHLGGALSKNLFLKDKKQRYYLISALAGTTIDMKILSQRLGLGKGGVRMAPEESLQELLHVPLGCVTPFALVNESASMVSLLLDQGFKAAESCYFHPLTNEVTIAINSKSLDKFLRSIGREPAYVDLEASPAVGKDNPPDLAFLVPSGVPETLSTAIDGTSSTLPDQHSAPSEKPNCASVNGERKSETMSGDQSKPSKSKPDLQKVTQPTDSANVEKFVNDICDKIFPLFVSELTNKLGIDSKELSERFVSERVRSKVGSDLEIMTTMFKNAAYSDGFHAGFETMLQRGTNGRPSWI